MTEQNPQDHPNDYVESASDLTSPVQPYNLPAGIVNQRQSHAERMEMNDVGSRKFVAYTVKLPAEQLAALQSIWLELKRLYGAHSPDKSGMIQQAIADWLKKWDGPEHQKLLHDLLEIRQDTRRRQYRKFL